MERVKNSFAAKTAAFILIIVCSVVVVLSAFVIMVNADMQWYSQSEESVKVDIAVSASTQADSQAYEIQEMIYECRYIAIAVCTISALLTVILFIFLIVNTGKKEGEDIRERYRTLRKVPAELIILVAGTGLIIAIVGSTSLIFGYNLEMLMAVIVIDTIVFVTVALGAILLLVVKVRQHSILTSSICFFVIKWTGKLLKWMWKAVKGFGKWTLNLVESIPLVWKTAVAILAGIMVNLFITVQISWSYGNAGMWLMWFIGAIAVEGVSIHTALGLRRLREGGKHLASGDLDYKIDKKGLYIDLAAHADDLNSIRQGMANAVEEKMKSERFKTELITNVSHDIKTPLTSIINYVDLLKKEMEKEDGAEKEKAAEYLEVLERQSQRMKKLTEDLVEASKAATGTVNLDMRPCKAGVLMMQAAGEYEEKMREENLKLISHMPDNQPEIMADGRSMWRILDNIFNNICKYSQPGTRIYQTLEQKDDKIIITYKNTSKYELNITEEELMERFVRGDSSRHTEGSGLGLSIAKNLAELQGGIFNIHIDGDLFKVVMEFPANML